MSGRWIYQRRGGPLLSWANGAPFQARAADAKSLGDYTSPPGNRMGLPRGGAPEFLGNYQARSSSNPPIGPQGLGGPIIWSWIGAGAERVVQKEIKGREPKAGGSHDTINGFGNYIAIGDDTASTPSATVSVNAPVAFSFSGQPLLSAALTLGASYLLYKVIRGKR